MTAKVPKSIRKKSDLVADQSMDRFPVQQYQLG